MLNSNVISQSIPAVFQDMWSTTCFGNKGWRHYVAHGGRGSGKSHGAAAYCMLESFNLDGGVILCAREFQNSIDDSSKALIEAKIREFGLQLYFKVTNTEIVNIITGVRFIFRGLKTNINSIKSIENIRICWIDEAQTISKKSIKVLTPTIRAEGSRLIWTFNPLDPSDPVDDLFRGDHVPPRSIVKQVNYDDNPFFPSVLREEMEADFAHDPELASHTWEGEYFSLSNASVFRNWKIQDFERLEDRWSDLNRPVRFGLDFGYSIDPCALVRGFMEKGDDKTLYIDYDECEVGVEIDDMADFVSRVPLASARWPIVADSARPEIISHLKRRNFSITGAIKGPDSVMEGIKWLQTKNIIIHPRCKATIREFKKYKFKVDEKTDDILPVLADKDNHIIDAVRYMTEKLRKGPSLTEVL